MNETTKPETEDGGRVASNAGLGNTVTVNSEYFWELVLGAKYAQRSLAIIINDDETRPEFYQDAQSALMTLSHALWGFSDIVKDVG